MDQKQLCGIIKPLLEDFSPSEINIELNGSEIKLEVVSNSFIGVRLIPRVKMVSKALSSAFIDKLVDFNLAITAVTSEEKYNGAIETGVRSNDNKNDSPEYAASCSP